MRILKNTIASAAALAVLVTTLPAGAQVCDEDSTQSALQYLRRLSIDLRGRLPDVSELESVVTNGSIDPAIIRGMLESDDAVAQMRNYHRDLLWTNTLNQRVFNQAWALRRGLQRNVDNAPTDVWFMTGVRQQVYRGARVPCIDEPARFDDQGNILTTRDEVNNANREGWVEVEPYWAPGTTVKVCAFDAQVNLRGRGRGGNMINCLPSGAQASECGCGPNLQWCHGVNAGTHVAVLNSVNEQLLRFTDSIFRDDRPYTDVITANDMEVNGPLSQFFRTLWNAGQNQLLVGVTQNYTMPEIAFNEADSWQRVDRGTRHAGVLTMPAFFIKFATDRGRANRFYNAFLCQAFEAPPGGLPAADDDCHQEPNLTKRCGCQFCHAALEPAASHWGRWGEAGLIALNEDQFPEINELCLRNPNNNICRRFYLTQANHPDEEQYVGTLMPYVFATEEMKTNISEGPIRIARNAIDSGVFASCTVNQMWQRYMGREATEDEKTILDGLTDGFRADYNLKNLIEAIVTRPEYVEAGRFTGKEG